MRKKRYFISHCVRLGEMPLFLIFYDDKRGHHGQCLMLCTFKKLRELLRKREGFEEPATYGHVLYSDHQERPNDMLVAMLKSRYDFDLEKVDMNSIRMP